jgi:hypothetical protein
VESPLLLLAIVDIIRKFAQSVNFTNSSLELPASLCGDSQTS